MTGYDALEDPDFTTWLVDIGGVYGVVPFEHWAEAQDYAYRYRDVGYLILIPRVWARRLRKSGKGKP